MLTVVSAFLARFVKYARPDEAAAAIAKFNRFRLQQYELHVSVALNSEQKAQRAERKKVRILHLFRCNLFYF